MALLQRARQETPAILRGRIEALSIDVTPAEAAAVQAALSNPKGLTVVDAVRFAMANGMQQVKDAALADLDTLVAGDTLTDPARYVHWLDRIRGEYADWLARVAKRKG